MYKLTVMLLLGSMLSIAMQPSQIQYNKNATNDLYKLFDKNDFKNPSHQEITRALQGIKKALNDGADPNIRPDSFYTPLIFAVDYYEQDPTVFTLLLNRGANPLGSGRSTDPYDLALQKRKFKIAGLLLDTGLDIEGKYFHNGNRLTDAIIKNYEQFVPELLKRGADFRKRRWMQIDPPAVPVSVVMSVDPLALAVLYDRTQAAKSLIEAGGDVNQIYNSNTTYLRRGPELNNGNRTLLMWAAERNNKEIVKSLLEHGAGDTAAIRNTQGKTALDIAREKGYSEIENLLKAHKLS